MLINAAARLLPPAQSKQFITKLVKEEIASKLIDKSIKLEDIAVNVISTYFLSVVFMLFSLMICVKSHRILQ